MVESMAPSSREQMEARRAAVTAQIQQRDLSTCPHQHTILAIADLPSIDGSVYVRAYRWGPPSVELELSFTLPPKASFTCLKDYVSLGVFTTAGRETLAQAITTGAARLPPKTAPSREIVSDLLKSCGDDPDPSGEHEIVNKLYSFSIRGEKEDKIVGEDEFAVYKWLKFGGSYRQMGSWDVDIGHALEDGEWNGGKDLILLVRGVLGTVWHKMVQQGGTTSDLDMMTKTRESEGATSATLD